MRLVMFRQNTASLVTELETLTKNVLPMLVCRRELRVACERIALRTLRIMQSRGSHALPEVGLCKTSVA